MNEEISDLLERLSRAVNDTLWNSEEVIDLMAALAAVGDFRISVDLLLPSTEALAKCSGYDEQFLKEMNIQP